MNHPHGDNDPIEHDPTGMRALLGSLPDPAPMPDDLVARISAALADEVRVRDGWPAPECPPELRADEVGRGSGALGSPEVGDASGVAGAGGGAAGTRGSGPRDRSDRSERGDGTVVPFRRRTAFRALTAAAAVIGVLGVTGAVIETVRPGGLQAALGVIGSAGGSADANSAGSAAGSGASAAAPRRPAVVDQDSDLRVVLLSAGGRVPSAELGSYAAGLPSAAFAKAADSAESAPQPASRPRLDTARGARACATGLGIGQDADVVLQPVRVDGARAAVVVTTAADGSRTAWAVSRTCSADAPGVLAGPVPVP